MGSWVDTVGDFLDYLHESNALREMQSYSGAKHWFFITSQSIAFNRNLNSKISSCVQLCHVI